MQATDRNPPGFRVSRKFLPYLLSLPALFACIGILVPS